LNGASPAPASTIHATVSMFAIVSTAGRNDGVVEPKLSPTAMLTPEGPPPNGVVTFETGFES